MISFLCPNSWLMSGDLAVVMDVAGTIMRMYRVAKDIPGDIILEKVEEVLNGKRSSKP